MNTTLSIFTEIKAEMNAQLEKWGEQNHPIIAPYLITQPAQLITMEYGLPSEEEARNTVDLHMANEDLSFMHVLIEEISEAASCGSDVEALRVELIQSAAVLITMIDSLDRNGR